MLSQAENEETIAAIATPLGEGGIGIIRISGPRSEDVLRAVFFPQKSPSRFLSHRLYFGEVKDPVTHGVLDEALACLMRAPHSYTGDDVAEISCHGGSMVVRKVLGAAVKAGARHAVPGEFTKRAYLNGRIDLAQAEAVLDLIRSRTDESHSQALALLQGSLSQRIHGIKDSLLGILSAVEAAIDFPEDDVEQPSSGEMSGKIDRMITDVGDLLGTYDKGKVIRDGVCAAFVGRPNVGKSSLFNALLGEDRAIVTEIPGTTRDYIEETADMSGYPVRLLDTAGIRQEEDRVEAEGVRRARERMNSADILILVLDGSEPLKEEDGRLIADCRGKTSVIAVNKSDLPLRLSDDELRPLCRGEEILHVSAKEKTGLERLQDAVIAGIRRPGPEPSPGVVITRQRHKDALTKARESLVKAREGAGQGLYPELISIDLRLTLDALGEITGETTAEDVLDRIFSEFCIGK